jgi:hypothetical protein
MENVIDEIYDGITERLLPFESWERVKGESGAAYAAFCVFRDLGPERNIVKAVAAVESDEALRGKKYRVWRNWAARFQWNKRAGDYDAYLDKVKLAERRKAIAEREVVYREVTGKMLDVVGKKLDLMGADELKLQFVAEWMRTAIDTEREVLGIAAEEKADDGQMALNFAGEFAGM